MAENDFAKKWKVTLKLHQAPKNLVEIALSRTISKINADGCQK